jgi:hypothetical protein
MALAPTWHSVHIHYHDRQRHDELLLGAVKPVFDQLPASVARAYFLRHWRRGPHIRVHVDAPDDAWRDEIRPLIERLTAAYLSRTPSAGHPDPEQEQRAHRELAALEQETGPLEPWRPDNSIHDAAYDHRLHILGTRESAELLASFHSDTTALAFALTREEHSDRMRLALTLMFATGDTACESLARGFISYRSHAEAYLASTADPAGSRARFERAYQACREPLADEMAAVTAGSGPADDRQVAQWVTTVRQYMRSVGDLHDANLLPLPRLEPRDVARRAVATGELSAFHDALFANDSLRDELNTARWFRVYRLLLNYQYLLFTRAGIPPSERFLLCYLAARTAEDAYGIGFDDLIDMVKNSRPRTVTAQ